MLKYKYYFRYQNFFFLYFLFLNFSINNFFIQIVKMMNKNLCIVNKKNIYMNKYFFFHYFFFLPCKSVTSRTLQLINQFICINQILLILVSNPRLLRAACAAVAGPAGLCTSPLSDLQRDGRLCVQIIFLINLQLQVYLSNPYQRTSQWRQDGEKF